MSCTRFSPEILLLQSSFSIFHTSSMIPRRRIVGILKYQKRKGYQYWKSYGQLASLSFLKFNMVSFGASIVIPDVITGVRYIFAGHYHRNAGGSYKDIEEVITGPIGAPLGNDPSGVRLVSVSINSISSKYVPITGV